MAFIQVVGDTTTYTSVDTTDTQIYDLTGVQKIFVQHQAIVTGGSSDCDIDFYKSNDAVNWTDLAVNFSFNEGDGQSSDWWEKNNTTYKWLKIELTFASAGTAVVTRSVVGIGPS